MKLTVKQNMVINCLQNGWEFITSSEHKDVTVCIGEFRNYTHAQFQISGTIFWNLVSKDLIYQQSSSPHEYVLTDLGASIKTKDVQDDIAESLT